MKKLRTKDLCLTALGAAFLCLCGMISFPLAPVAISLQSLGIFAVAGLLGTGRSLAATVLYLALGALGLPVFAGLGGGIAVLAGPSGGFLWAFIPASILVALAAKKEKASTLVLALILTHLLLYTIGSLWYYLLFANGASFGGILAVTVLPFLLPDAIKAALAFVLIRRLRGKFLS